VTMRLDTITPRGGASGTAIVMAGDDFGITAGRVIFDPLGAAIAATPTLWIPDRIEFLVPAGLQRDCFLTLLIERNGGADSVYLPFWIPRDALSDPVTPDYQYPLFDAGGDLTNASIDDPRLAQAADFNRNLDRVHALEAGTVGGVMLRTVYDTNDNGIVDNSEAIDDGGTPRTWADIVALAAAGIDPKDACRATTTQDLSLEGTGFSYNSVGGASGRGQFAWTAGPTTLDTVPLASGDRILVKDQTNGDQNGIWVRTSVNVWDRSIDFDDDAEVSQGAFTLVAEGTHAGKGFILITPDPITIGGVTGTVLTWTDFFRIGLGGTPVAVTPGNAASEGSSANASRADHEHEFTSEGETLMIAYQVFS